MLEKSATEFVAGDTLSIADFQLFAQLMDFHYGCSDFDKWPLVTKWHDRCLAVKSIGEVHGPGTTFTTKAIPLVQ